MDTSHEPQQFPELPDLPEVPHLPATPKPRPATPKPPEPELVQYPAWWKSVPGIVQRVDARDVASFRKMAQTYYFAHCAACEAARGRVRGSMNDVELRQHLIMALVYAALRKRPEIVDAIVGYLAREPPGCDQLDEPLTLAGHATWALLQLAKAPPDGLDARACLRSPVAARLKGRLQASLQETAGSLQKKIDFRLRFGCLNHGSDGRDVEAELARTQALIQLLA